MRCFIAIPLPKYTHEELAKIQSQLKETKADVAWVKTDNIHLTLKFLGNVDETKIQLISQKLKDSLSKCVSFETDIGKLGAFPTLSNPRVIWIGIDKNEDKIKNLQKITEEILGPFGFEKETRPFHPHLTLGRVRDKKNIQKLTEKLKSLPLPQLKPITVDKIILFQSILKPTGAEYNTLNEFQLKVES
ncbi:MAG: RNA 2',3'-cyclic phosphodiesterase [Candidatus Ratteibacteria bacterium]|nr:RNA 2',3'-cyclic phosphodiesterase [Candidatus Ratteibacteria bacterium]